MNSRIITTNRIVGWCWWVWSIIWSRSIRCCYIWTIVFVS